MLGKINFVRGFISNLSQKVLPFSPLLKLKKDQKLKQIRGIDDHCLRRALALLPSASSEARRRLRRCTMLAWDVHCLKRGRAEIGKDSRVKRLGGELGAPTVTFIGLAR
jgi:hypothetical protein